jgi:hypothetical protein
MAVRVLLSVKEAWIVAHSLTEKRDFLRMVIDDSGREQTSACNYVRQDLEIIEATLAKILTPDSWTD